MFLLLTSYQKEDISQIATLYSKLFFCEKSLSKKFDNKNGKKNCQNRKLKINIFLQKNLKNGHFEAKAYGESKFF